MVNEDSEPSQSQPIEILLVDDHPRVRQLLRYLIESYDDLSVVGEAVNGEDNIDQSEQAIVTVQSTRQRNPNYWTVGG